MSQSPLEKGELRSNSEGRAGSSERLQSLEQIISRGIKALPSLDPSLEEFWTFILVKTRDGSTWSSPTKVVRPKVDANPRQPRPLVIYYFGGGFTRGSPDMMVRPAREWAQHYNATVLLPTYRLIGEVKWPEFHEDGLKIVQAIAAGYVADGYEPYFGANLRDGFILGGASAGGTIAAVVAGLTSFSQDPVHQLAVPLTGAFLSIALILRPEIVPEEYRNLWKSLAENAVPQGEQDLSAARLEEIVQSFRLKDHDIETPWFSPVNFWHDGNVPNGKSHPPTYFQCGQHDPLRDDAIVYEKMLSKTGVRTKLDLFPDDGHITATVMPLPTFSKGPTVLEATIGGLGWLLEQNQQWLIKHFLAL